jgi:hypothetical protein
MPLKWISKTVISGALIGGALFGGAIQVSAQVNGAHVQPAATQTPIKAKRCAPLVTSFIDGVGTVDSGGVKLSFSHSSWFYSTPNGAIHVVGYSASEDDVIYKSASCMLKSINAR